MTKYGSLKANFRAYYLTHRDKEGEFFDANISESLALGGSLEYESPKFGDIFSFGLTGYGVTPVGVFDQKDRGGTELLDDNNEGYAVLGKAYALLEHWDSYIKVYRQDLETPLINGDDDKMVPNLFEAYTAGTSLLPDVNFTLGYVDKMKAKNSDVFKSMTRLADDDGVQSRNSGVIMAGLEWTPAEFISTQIWNYNSPDYINMAFAQIDLTHSINDDLEIHGSVIGLDQRSSGSQDGGDFNSAEFGVLAGFVWKGFGIDVGGTFVDDTRDITCPWGGVPFFTSMTIADNDRAGEQTFFLGASYDFSEIGVDNLNVAAMITLSQTPDSGPNASPDQNEYDFEIDYAFDGALDGLSLTNQYAYLDQDEGQGGQDGMEVRLKFEYELDIFNKLLAK
ncbi:OprD family outer membrane porin [Desulfovibrio sp. JC010]|uniref:OprD family outer membrane porin n=1 Tax=Desulfovibrio sp. JC010 TaxID=2593641 RepID=UPI0013CF95F2|nr:OprD family outer membrane porin [Desulfovibrio sp. JC010]